MEDDKKINDTAVEALSKQIMNAIRKFTAKLSYDSTVKGVIISSEKYRSTYKYKVSIYGQNYEMFSSTNVDYKSGEKVYITIPQGNKNEMFISGRCFK